MRISVSQIYIRPGINFPFSHAFQRWISEQLTEIVGSSEEFIRLYGEDFAILFNLSAKTDIQNVEIKGPTISRKTKQVEYTIFLPYDSINQNGDRMAGAVRCLLSGIILVIESLGIDAGEVIKRIESITEYVSSHGTMIKSG